MNNIVVEGVKGELPVLTKVRCGFNSSKEKSRRAMLFGEVLKDGKVIRHQEYLLIQDEGFKKGVLQCRKFVEVPKR